jgi:hypothetical protein
VISGASSLLRKVRAEQFRFTIMTVPHADDSPGHTSRSPDEHHQPRIEPSNCYEPGPTIVVAIIGSRKVESREDPSGPAHIETPLLKRALPLQRIAGDAHIYCRYV